MTRQDALLTIIAAAGASAPPSNDQLCTVLRALHRLDVRQSEVPALFLLLRVSDRNGNFYPRYQNLNQRRTHEDATNTVL